MDGQVRASVARVLLWFAVIWWGVWFGGQMFNALMVVPHFSAAPPQSLAGWYQLRYDNLLDFFLTFNALWIFLALALALLVGGRALGGRRKWMAVSALAALVATVMLFGWMVRTIVQVVTPDNGLSAAETVRLLRLWTAANWVRLAIELVGFVAALKALSAPPLTAP